MKERLRKMKAIYDVDVDAVVRKFIQQTGEDT